MRRIALILGVVVLALVAYTFWPYSKQAKVVIHPPGTVAPVQDVAVLIRITDEDRYIYDGTDLPLSSVEPLVNETRIEHGSLKDVSFVLEAADASSDGSLVELMAELQRAGAINVTIRPVTR